MWRGPNRIAIEERAEPLLEPGGALIRVELTGLCGTDLAIFAGHHERAAAPLVMGHEMVGIVEAVDGVGPPPGTRVAVNPLLPCEQCWPCRNGLTHACRQLRLLGIDRDGSLAELVAVPAAALVAMGRDTPARSAVLVEPLAVAIRAVRRAQVQPGDAVMIFGAGPIGILTGLVAQAAGADPIMVVEPNLDRRAVAQEAGLIGVEGSARDVRDAVLHLTAGIGADVTFDTAGHPAVPPLLTAVTREHGTIVIAGLHHQPAALDLHALVFAEQRLIGSRVYSQEDFTAAVAAVESDLPSTRRLPVRILPLAEASQALTYASSQPAVVKVMIASTEGAA